MKRLAAIYLHELSLEAVFSVRDDRAPRAIFTERRGKVVLQAVSEAARNKGIRRGMSRSEGRAALRELDVRPRREALESVVLARAAELAFTFGPIVEIATPDVLFVDVSQTPALSSGTADAEQILAQRIVHIFNQAGHAVRVVIADTPDTARTVAQWPTATKTSKKKQQKLQSWDVISAGTEAERLQSLAIAALCWTDPRQDPDGKQRESLRQAEASLAVLGVRDGRRLTALPAEQLGNRFGAAGKLLASRVRGTRDRPLAGFVPPEHLSEDAEFDHPTEALGPVLAVVERLLERLALRLEARCRAVNNVQLVFRVEPNLHHEVKHDAPRTKNSQWDETVELRFARPTRKAQTLISLANETLGQSLGGLVRSIRIEAHAPDLDTGAQLDLFNQHARRTEDVAELISRLQASLGPDAVFKPMIVDTHRPESAWKRVPFDIERALAEPKTLKTRPVQQAEMVTTLHSSQTQSATLPRVDDALGVTEFLPLFAGQHSSCEQAPTPPPATLSRWPKPLPRMPEDEPLAALPTRPLTLLDPPERAGFTQGSSIDEGILHWRKERLPLVSMSAREELDTEWWQRVPLVREYRVAETAEGRRFWVFFDACGELFVHGIFD